MLGVLPRHWGVLCSQDSHCLFHVSMQSGEGVECASIRSEGTSASCTLHEIPKRDWRKH